jgi:hypothetical protein
MPKTNSLVLQMADFHVDSLDADLSVDMIASPSRRVDLSMYRRQPRWLNRDGTSLPLASTTTWRSLESFFRCYFKQKKVLAVWCPWKGEVGICWCAVKVWTRSESNLCVNLNFMSRWSGGLESVLEVAFPPFPFLIVGRDFFKKPL